MPDLDSITPNPKQPKRMPRATRVGVSPLPLAEQARRRKLMWAIVAGVFVIILAVWVVTFPSRIATGNTNQSAWSIIKDKLVSAFSFGKDGDSKIKAINADAPTAEDLEYLREQIFPAAPVENVNSSTNSSTETPTNAS